MEVVAWRATKNGNENTPDISISIRNRTRVRIVQCVLNSCLWLCSRLRSRLSPDLLEGLVCLYWKREATGIAQRSTSEEICNELFNSLCSNREDVVT